MNTINELLNKINKEKSGDTLSLADIIGSVALTKKVRVKMR
ncbi:hypothetical protein [Xenorhabdus bovienii]|nr:hypothetical protein [Xenorhabdus bovienii]